MTEKWGETFEGKAPSSSETWNFRLNVNKDTWWQFRRGQNQGNGCQPTGIQLKPYGPMTAESGLRAGLKRQDLTLVHCNPCTAQMESFDMWLTHAECSLGAVTIRTRRQTLKNRQYVPNAHSCQTLKKRHCAQAATRQTVLSVLSVLSPDHEECMKNLH